MGSARSIGILTALNMGGAVLALASSVVTAHYFGTSRALEVFFAASTLETLMLSLSQSGQLSEILIPVYHRLKQAEGRDSAQRAYSVVTNWMMIWLVLLATLMWGLAPWLARLLTPGFGVADHEAVATMFRWLVPMLPLQVLLSLLHGVSNAEKWFGKPEWFGLVTQAAGLAVVLALASRLGTWALVLSLWVNQLLLLGGLVWILRQLGYRHRLLLRHPGCPMVPLLRQLATTLGYVLSTQFYSFTLNAGLSLLPQGAYATFNYVQRLYSKTNGILLRPVSVVFFTHFSEALAAGSDKVRALLQTALSRNLTMSALALVGTCVAAPGAVRALWGGRQFQAEQLELASTLWMLFMVLLVSSGFAQIVRKLVISCGWISRLYAALALAQVGTGILAYFLPKYFGVPGAAATFLLNGALLAIACAVLLYLARPDLMAFFAWSEIWRWSLAGSGGYFLGAITLSLGGSLFPAGRFWLGFSSAVAAALACAAASGMAWLLRVEDIRKLFAFIGKRLQPAAPAGASAI